MADFDWVWDNLEDTMQDSYIQGLICYEYISRAVNKPCDENRGTALQLPYIDLPFSIPCWHTEELAVCDITTLVKGTDLTVYYL